MVQAGQSRRDCNSLVQPRGRCQGRQQPTRRGDLRPAPGWNGEVDAALAEQEQPSGRLKRRKPAGNRRGRLGGRRRRGDSPRCWPGGGDKPAWRLTAVARCEVPRRTHTDKVGLWRFDAEHGTEADGGSSHGRVAGQIAAVASRRLSQGDRNLEQRRRLKAAKPLPVGLGYGRLPVVG